MTTVAWDGIQITCDSLRTDAWGLMEYEPDKVFVGKDFLIGGSGDWAPILRFYKKIANMSAEEVLELGYPDFKKDENEPSLMLITPAKEIYVHGAGVWMRIRRGFHAIGSGRDFALMAMYLGKSSSEAVTLASHFDSGTKPPLITYHHPA